MRTITVTAVAAVVGFIFGIVLSEIIGIVGYLASGRALGIKFLPIYLAILFAVGAPLAYKRIRRRGTPRNPF
jgi:hypothetical protein